MDVVLAKRGLLGYHIPMTINSILDVSPELASDIQYLWDEAYLTSEQIVEEHREQCGGFTIPLEVVWDILGGAYIYEDNQN